MSLPKIYSVVSAEEDSALLMYEGRALLPVIVGTTKWEDGVRMEARHMATLIIREHERLRLAAGSPDNLFSEYRQGMMVPPDWKNYDFSPVPLNNGCYSQLMHRVERQVLAANAFAAACGDTIATNEIDSPWIGAACRGVLPSYAAAYMAVAKAAPPQESKDDYRRDDALLQFNEHITRRDYHDFAEVAMSAADSQGFSLFEQRSPAPKAWWQTNTACLAFLAQIEPWHDRHAGALASAPVEVNVQLPKLVDSLGEKAAVLDADNIVSARTAIDELRRVATGIERDGANIDAVCLGAVPPDEFLENAAAPLPSGEAKGGAKTAAR